MPGLSLTTTSRSCRAPSVAALFVTFVLALGACKQDAGERCERNEDCANPELYECASVNRLTLNDGTCQLRSRPSMTVDSGAGTDGGADGGERVEGGAEAAAETASDTPGEVAPATDGAADVPETASTDAPASEVVPDLPAADLVSEAG